MFVRGGVYRVVKEAMGGTLGKMSVSALLFDYILTGPISATSAGQYIVGLLNDLSHRAGSSFHLPPNETSAALAAVGDHLLLVAEHAGAQRVEQRRARIMQITTVMVVLLLAWSALTLFPARRPSAAAADASQHHLLRRRRSAG